MCTSMYQIFGNLWVVKIFTVFADMFELWKFAFAHSLHMPYSLQSCTATFTWSSRKPTYHTVSHTCYIRSLSATNFEIKRVSSAKQGGPLGCKAYTQNCWLYTLLFWLARHWDWHPCCLEHCILAPINKLPSLSALFHWLSTPGG